MNIFSLEVGGSVDYLLGEFFWSWQQLELTLVPGNEASLSSKELIVGYK